ncbi:hypothetical protein [Azospirillum sp. sgz302134]
MSVLDEIAAERRRQDEKWGGARHDDGHAVGALVIAGVVYALDAVQGYYSPDVTVVELSSDMLRKHSPCGHNRTDGARQRLVKAGALIVAELERLDRAETAAAREEWIGEVVAYVQGLSADWTDDKARPYAESLFHHACTGHQNTWPDAVEVVEEDREDWTE